MTAKTSDAAPAVTPMTLADLIALIQVRYRIYDNLRRMHQRADLQIKALERRMAADARLEAAGEISATERMMREVGLQETIAELDPQRQAYRTRARKHERELARLATMLPVHPWQKSVRGFGEKGLACIIAECGDLRDYSGPAKVWKRMGLAVINGERQRRVKGAEALDHGYVPRRAALMFNIGESLLKGNGEGIYADTYRNRKQTEQERHPEWQTAKARNDEGRLVGAHPKHYHNRARRYMTKLLLRHLWQAWRDMESGVLAQDVLTDADLETDDWTTTEDLLPDNEAAD